MPEIQVRDKVFKPYISKEHIAEKVAELAARISDDYSEQVPLFISVLNGSFIFAADLFRALSIPAEITFVKLASYEGTSSTGNVITTIGLNEKLQGRHVILLEDIIDTGRTLHHFIPEVLAQQPASFKMLCLLSKPSALQYDVRADYVGFEIPDNFVVGYGLDYDGHGRNLADLYTLVQ